MRVKSIMTSDPVSIRRNASIADAIAIMKDNAIRHLPVVDRENRLVGFLTLADLKQGFLPSLVADVDLKDLMISNPFTAHVNDDVEDAARLIHKKKIGGMPVVDDNGRLAGVITVIDILGAFIEMMGLLTQSVRLLVETGPGPDAVSRACAIITGAGGNIISIGLPDAKPDSPKRVFRLETAGSAEARKALADAGYKVAE
ncbi:MAG: CBS domain-containing protein [Deltaproteobacteria bacterium]|nr:CBS domain-containing protein [Deltaproteobacteria bacterium]